MPRTELRLSIVGQYMFRKHSKLESKIPWKEFGLLLFKYCLKNGFNVPMNMPVKHVS